MKILDVAMNNIRPEFKEIISYKEFSKYYWYRDELQEICKRLGIEYVGNKIELNNYIEEYFSGNLIKHQKKVGIKKRNEELTVDTKLLDFGFALRNEYRDFFGQQTGIKNFRYTADMTAALNYLAAELRGIRTTPIVDYVTFCTTFPYLIT